MKSSSAKRLEVPVMAATLFCILFSLAGCATSGAGAARGRAGNSGPPAAQSEPQSASNALLSDMTKGIPTSDNTFAASQRDLVRSADGTLYLAYVKSVAGYDQVFVAKSTNQGASWSDIAQVSSGPSTSSNPDLVIDSKGHLMVLWTKEDILTDGKAAAQEGERSALVGAGEMTTAAQTPAAQTPAAQTPAAGGRRGADASQSGAPVAEGAVGAPGPDTSAAADNAAPAKIEGVSSADAGLSANAGRATGTDDVEHVSGKNAEIQAEEMEAGGKGDAEDEHMRQIYSSTFDGSHFTPQKQLTSGEYNGFPSAAYDRSGVLQMVWYGFDGKYYQVAYSKLERGVWSRPDQISIGFPDSVNPSIAVDSHGNLHVAWYKYSRESRSYQINYREREVAKGRWTAQAQISYGLQTAMNVSMVVDDSDRVYLTYDGLRAEHDNSGVYLRVKDAEGWGDQLEIAPPALNASLPTISRDPETGAIYVFYQEDRDKQIQYVSGERSGGALEWTGPRTLTSAGRNGFPNARWSRYFNPFTGPNAIIDVVWTELNADPGAQYGPNLIHYAGIPSRSPVPSNAPRDGAAGE